MSRKNKEVWFASLVPDKQRSKLPAPPGSKSELRNYARKPCPYCADLMTSIAKVHSEGKSGSLKYDKKFPTRDHVIPKSQGKTLKDNKIIVCRECNELKGPRDLKQFLNYLELLPASPKNNIRKKHVAALLSAIESVQLTTT